MCHNRNVAIVSYRDKGTRDIAIGEDTKEARKLLPSVLYPVARKRLAYLSAVESIADLRARNGLGLHSLKGDRVGQFAIKINEKYRICFLWNKNNASAVEITDYH